MFRLAQNGPQNISGQEDGDGITRNLSRKKDLFENSRKDPGPHCSEYNHNKARTPDPSCIQFILTPANSKYLTTCIF
jgi:hypothetical protein